MARKKPLRETTAAPIDSWTKTVGEKVFYFKIIRAVEMERGLVTKVFYTNVLQPKDRGSMFQKVTYEQLNREQVEELFAKDLQ